ncbi:MAG TPA: SHOCT domain-containing protein [Symbiobacteriaceae bacterium]
MAVNLLLVAGLIALGYWVFKRSPGAESEAMQTLRLRLAKGEITAEEFDVLRQKLQG